MENNIKKMAVSFIFGAKKENIPSEYFCETRDVFQARLDKMTNALLTRQDIKNDDAYIISAITGEIGNNSFDHNIGTWVGEAGIFFGHDFKEDKLEIVLADAGQGVYNTLKKVKPELANDEEALLTAFNEKITGRAPEARGNGLKFVKANIKNKNMHLTFISGQAKADLNQTETIVAINENYQGCLAVIEYKL